MAMISSPGSKGGCVLVGGGVPNSQEADEFVDMARLWVDKADGAPDRETDSPARALENRLPRSTLSDARLVFPFDHCVLGTPVPLVGLALEKGCRPRLTGREPCFIYVPEPLAP